MCEIFLLITLKFKLRGFAISKTFKASLGRDAKEKSPSWPFSSKRVLHINLYISSFFLSVTKHSSGKISVSQPMS